MIRIAFIPFYDNVPDDLGCFTGSKALMFDIVVYRTVKDGN